MINYDPKLDSIDTVEARAIKDLYLLLDGRLDATNFSTRAIGEKQLTNDAWHIIGAANEPAFENSWTNYNANYDQCAFMKDSMGFVHLRGMLKGGTVGDVAVFTLPVGYRVPIAQYLPIASNGTIGNVYIESGGTVRIMHGSNVWASLCGITFKTA